MNSRTCIQCGRTENEVVIKPKHAICISCLADKQLLDRYGYIMEEPL